MGRTAAAISLAVLALLLVPCTYASSPMGLYQQWALRTLFPWEFPILLGVVSIVLLFASIRASRVPFRKLALPCIFTLVVVVKEGQELGPAILLPFVPFWTMLLYPSNRILIWDALRALLSLQVLAGLAVWLLRVDQFETPGFGYRACALLGTPDAFYPLCVAAALLFIGESSTRSTWMPKVAMIMLAVTAVYLCYRTGSRSALVALVVGSISLALLGNRQAMLVVCVSIAMTAGIWVARTEAVHGQDGSVAGRLESDAIGLKVWRSSPIFGGGSLAFMHSKEFATFRKQKPLAPRHPKSLYVKLASEAGLAGLILFLLLLHRSLLAGKTLMFPRQRSWNSCGIHATVWAYGTASFFDTPAFGTWVMSASTSCFLVVCAASLAPPPNERGGFGHDQENYQYGESARNKDASDAFPQI